jgi:hypothetical protein
LFYFGGTVLKNVLLLILIALFCVPSMLQAQADDPVRLQVSDVGAFVYQVPDDWEVEGSREELLLASSELALFLMENSTAPIAALPDGETVISFALMDPQVIVSTFDLPESATPVELLDGLGFWMNDLLTLEVAQEFEINGQAAAISHNTTNEQTLNVLLYFLFPDRIAVVTILSNGDIPENTFDIIESIRYRRQADIYEDDEFIADVPVGWGIEADDREYVLSNVMQKASRSSVDLEAGEYIFTVMNLTPEEGQDDDIDLAEVALELAESVASDDAEISDARSFRVPGDLVPVEGRTFVQVTIQSEDGDDGGVIVTQNNRQQMVALIYAANHDEGDVIAWTAIWTALIVRFK